MSEPWLSMTSSKKVLSGDRGHKKIDVKSHPNLIE
jgi:hypothetical protein